MGYYLNELPVFGKVDAILKKYKGSEIIDPPEEWQPDLVCVVKNSGFEAALYCYSEEEFKVAMHNDGRPKIWMIVPKVADLILGFDKEKFS